MSLDFLLEIGTEEIPHWMIPGALTQLAKLDLLGATPQVDATPRRLVVRAQGLPERTPDSEQIVKGPPITAGDKAAEGFAKKQGADASALRKAGNYYELVKKVSGRGVSDILAESLPGAGRAQRHVPPVPLVPSRGLERNAHGHRVLDRALVKDPLQLEPVRRQAAQLGAHGVA